MTVNIFLKIFVKVLDKGKQKRYYIVKKFDKESDYVNIKEFRLRKGFTQEAFAEVLKTKRSTVAMWESGQSVPRADKLPELAKILDCTIDELFQ